MVHNCVSAGFDPLSFHAILTTNDQHYFITTTITTTITTIIITTILTTLTVRLVPTSAPLLASSATSLTLG